MHQASSSRARLAPRPSEAIFDKITMSAFEGTPLTITLRDCRITAVAITGIAMKSASNRLRAAADLGIIPVVVTDACGAGHPEAAQRSIDGLTFAGDAMMTTTTEFCGLLDASALK